MKRALIVFVIILLSIGAYFYLKHYYQANEVEIWDLVPKNAIAVYETDQLIQVWNEVLILPLWENLSTIPDIQKINQSLLFLDSITGSDGDLERLFRDRTILLSVNKISNTELGLIYFLPVNNAEKRSIFNSILTYFSGKENIKQSERIFEGFSIHEIGNYDDDKIFSFVEYKNFVIGSYTSFLIEDVIRNISSEFENNFKTTSAEVFMSQPLEEDQGNLYINLARVSDVIRSFINPSISGDENLLLESLSGATYYDISFEENKILFNGSTYITGNGNKLFMNTFTNQVPQSINSIYTLPRRTATYLNFTFDDFVDWRNAVDDFWAVKNPDLFEQKVAFLGEYELLEKDLYDWVGNEIGLATLSSIDMENPDKLVIIHADNVNEGLKQLNDLASQVALNRGDTVLYEDFYEQKIRQIPIAEMPFSLFGDGFEGFENTYFTSYNDFIILGNSFEVIKLYISDLLDDSSWGKSLKFIDYFDNVQKSANISYFINFSNAWNSFYHSLNPDWSVFFKQYDHQFKHFEYMSFQFSNINNHYYTSAAVQHRPPTSVIETPTDFFKQQVAVTDYPIITKPYAFRSHLDKQLEVLVQDSAKYLYFISSDGKILWTDSIGDPIRGDIFQVDYYKNGKLQYLFATDKGLYILDRNGESLPDYPVRFDKPIDIEWVNLIDYDRSKNYRVLLADHDGKVYLFNKEGESLEGWQPKELSGAFCISPFHVRISGRDFIIAPERSGTMNVLNRRGEFYDGFPYKLDHELAGPVFVQSGNNLQRSSIHLVQETGELIQLNLLGNVISKKQLYKPGDESVFRIVPDVMDNTYGISRHDFNSINLLDKNGEVLFEQELLSSSDLDVQYYHFGAGNEVFAITDKTQEFTYLYDGNGVLFNQQPVESSQLIGLLYSEVNNQYSLYSCYGNQFSISTFYKK